MMKKTITSIIATAVMLAALPVGAMEPGAKPMIKTDKAAMMAAKADAKAARAKAKADREAARAKAKADREAAKAGKKGK